MRRFARRPDSLGRCGRNRYLIGRFASSSAVIGMKNADVDIASGPGLKAFEIRHQMALFVLLTLIISWSSVIPAKGGLVRVRKWQGVALRHRVTRAGPAEIVRRQT